MAHQNQNQLLLHLIKTSCVACRKRHRRCDGQLPCAFCLKGKADCVYETPKRPGRKPRREEDSSGVSQPTTNERSIAQKSFPTIIVGNQLGNSWTVLYLQHLQELGIEWVVNPIPLPSPDILWQRRTVGELTIVDQEQMLLMYGALTAGAALTRLSRCIRDNVADSNRNHIQELFARTESLWRSIRDSPIGSAMRPMALTLWSLALLLDGQPVLGTCIVTAAKQAICALAELNPNTLARSSLMRWLSIRIFCGLMKRAPDSEERLLWFNKCATLDAEFPISRVSRVSFFVIDEIRSTNELSQQKMEHLLSLLSENETLIAAQQVLAQQLSQPLLPWKNCEILTKSCLAFIWLKHDFEKATRYVRQVFVILQSNSRLPTCDSLFVCLCLLSVFSEYFLGCELGWEYVQLIERYGNFYPVPTHVKAIVQSMRRTLQGENEEEVSSEETTPAVNTITSFDDEKVSNMPLNVTTASFSLTSAVAIRTTRDAPQDELLNEAWSTMADWASNDFFFGLHPFSISDSALTEPEAQAFFT